MACVRMVIGTTVGTAFSCERMFAEENGQTSLGVWVEQSASPFVWDVKNVRTSFRKMKIVEGNS